MKIIAAATNKRDRFLMEVMYYSGIRRFEVAQLRIEDIDFKKEDCFNHVIRKGKGGKKRNFLLPFHLTERLKNFINVNRVRGFLF